MPRLYLLSFDESPEGMPVLTPSRGSHRCFFYLPMPSTAEGCFREGETQSHLNFEPHRCLCSAASQRKASAKESWDCLTYSRLWYLSRDKHNRLWPTSAKGIGFKTYPQRVAVNSVRTAQTLFLSAIFAGNIRPCSRNPVLRNGVLSRRVVLPAVARPALPLCRSECRANCRVTQHPAECKYPRR